MNQDLIEQELFAEFIIEAREHLETIEPNLLKLEEAPDSTELLNDIFRPMHSLKGTSGFLGLNTINRLAHKAEGILDELRNGAMTVTPGIMDVILSATDALEQIVENLRTTGAEGNVAIDRIIEQIDAIMSGENPTPTPRPTTLTHDQWIDSLPLLDSYALTSFGEGHLKDFIDEAREIAATLSQDLLDLEGSPSGSDEIVNDLFRYFHNLKGNSGLVGFLELNGMTHEAETLLNRVRKAEIPASRELIDLLLLVIDAIEALVARINPAEGTVEPFDVSGILACLKEAVAGGTIQMPEALRPAVVTKAPQPAVDEGELALFAGAIEDRIREIESSLAEIEKDASRAEPVETLHGALVAIENTAEFMGFDELKVYAARTAALVDQARTSDMDFSLMLDLLQQEYQIIEEMARDIIHSCNDKPASSTEQAVSPAESAPASAPPASPVPVRTRAKVQVKKEQAPADAWSETFEPLEQPQPVKKTPKKSEQPQIMTRSLQKSDPPQPVKKSPPVKEDIIEKMPVPPTKEDSKTSSTIRVDHERLDQLMNLIGELIINRNRYALITSQIEHGGEGLDMSAIAHSLSETTYSMARISDELQNTIMKVRMMPVSSVFSRFPRLVRDLSRKSGKAVDLVLEGEETELDKSVVEVIGDPLVHLIRNSMDHGIEDAAERKALGKPAKGKIILRAYHKGNTVVIEIEDDGRGLDPHMIRSVAVKKGLMSREEAAALDDSDARELIFAPGFSSAEKITDISGRGVGMDVVRTNIKNLKGNIGIHSEVGKGTRFTLSLPLTLAIIDALIVEVSGEVFAIPLDAVSETTKIETARLSDLKGRKALTLREEVLGIVHLDKMLRLTKEEKESDVLSVVIIHDNERRLGLVVDKLHQRQEIVIKPLSGAYLGDVRAISGATIMGDGSVVLILDPHELYLMATTGRF